jgi:hypothetical protein
MEQAMMPDWEPTLVDEAIKQAEDRIEAEHERARKRAVQLAREQAYHRLAVEIARPGRVKVHSGQLSFFPTDPKLFDD